MAKKSAGENRASEVITTSTIKMWRAEDGLLRGEFLPGVHVTLNNARENIASYNKLIPSGQPLPMLIDIRALRSISSEAREFYASPEMIRHITRLAMLIESPVSRVLGAFFLRLNKLEQPIRMFSTESQALAWLRESS